MVDHRQQVKSTSELTGRPSYIGHFRITGALAHPEEPGTVFGRHILLADTKSGGGFALPRDVQGIEDWAAVGDAVRKRMRELKMSTAKLARETGLSETTIRYIGQPDNRHHKSALVAISAVLRWRYDYLMNILHGESHKNAPPGTQTETRLERVVHAEVGRVKDEMAGLKNIVHGIDKKVDVLLAVQRPGGGRKS